MQRTRIAQFDIPLFIRVVCLYGFPLVFILPGIVAQTTAHEVAAAPTPQFAIVKETLPTKKLTSGEPVRMELERLDIRLPIVDGAYNPKTSDWSIAEDKAQFANNTIVPNDSHGITWLYGHNTMAVFKPLRDLRSGDKLVVHTNNRHVFTYTYVRDKLVDPTDTSVLYEQSSEPLIALITCDGAWSEHRRIMYFSLQDVA